MLEPESQRTELAASAQEKELTLLVHDPSPKVIMAMLDNRNVTEEHVLIIANRKNLPPEVLNAIFRDKRWSESYPVRLALAKNPKTPLFTALSIARFLRLFDLAELARNHFIPVVYRRKLEAIVIEKIPSLALGVKKTLARIAGGEILLALIKDGYPEVVRNCLENPRLVEAHLYRIISRKTTTPATIRTIAENRNWSCRYHVKFALIRNAHTPLARSVLFLPDLKLLDLKELYRDPLLPQEVKPFIHRELVDRGVDPEHLGHDEAERIFEIEESDIADIEREMQMYENGEVRPDWPLRADSDDEEPQVP
jgi:hypothetical protein